MNLKRIKRICLGAASVAVATLAIADTTGNVIDEVAWVVGDEPIYKSEIEEYYQQAQAEGQSFPISPYCAIPEQMAVEKLYLNQAKIDTIEVPENAVQNAVSQRLNYLVNASAAKSAWSSSFIKAGTRYVSSC